MTENNDISSTETDKSPRVVVIDLSEIRSVTELVRAIADDDVVWSDDPETEWLREAVGYFSGSWVAEADPRYDEDLANPF